MGVGFSDAWIDAGPPLAALDADGRVVAANAAVLTLLGVDRPAMVGRPLASWLAGEGSSDLRCALKRGGSSDLIVRLETGRREAQLNLRPFQQGSESFFSAFFVPMAPRAETSRPELRLRELFDHSADGIFVVDQSGRFIDANSTACDMLGLTREECLSRPMMDVVDKEDRERLVRTMEQLREPGQSLLTEWTVYRKGGGSIPAEVSSKVLSDGSVQAFVRDITQRKEADRDLRLAEERLRQAQRIAGLGSWEWDLLSNRMERSPEIYELYGVEPEPGLEASLSLMRFIPAADRALINRAIAEALEKGGHYTVEHRVVRPDGEERILRQRGEVIMVDGVAVRIVGTALDITTLRRAEKEKDAALRQLRAVLDAVPVGIMIAQQQDSSPLVVNRRGRELRGEQSTLLTTSGEPVASAEAPLLRALQGERTEPEEFLLRHGDGRTLPIRASAVPVTGPTGEVYGAVAAFDDISSEKELERLRTEWSAVVAHDLRQPLAILGLYLEVLCREVGANSPHAQATRQRIKRTIHRMDRMIRDLADFGQLEAGRVVLERGSVDLVSLTQELCGIADLQTPGRPIRFQADCEVAPVCGDRDRLHQILDNLITNALKYGTRDTPIDVRLTRRDDKVVVSVSNHGPGLSPLEVRELFQRFHRTPAARQSGIRGIGLGLAIVRALVAAHGGEISVESTPGGTTTFFFSLPCAAEASVSAASAPP
jgi:PAS domain S-box-containing protein